MTSHEPSSPTMLPLEVLGQIIEFAAWENQRARLGLCLVSRSLKPWVDSVLYHTIILKTVISANLFLRTLDAFDAKDRTFLARNVRVLMLMRPNPAAALLSVNDTKRLLSACPHIVRLSYSGAIHNADDSPRAPPAEIVEIAPLIHNLQSLKYLHLGDLKLDLDLFLPICLSLSDLSVDVDGNVPVLKHYLAFAHDVNLIVRFISATDGYQVLDIFNHTKLRNFLMVHQVPITQPNNPLSLAGLHVDGLDRMRPYFLEGYFVDQLTDVPIGCLEPADADVLVRGGCIPDTEGPGAVDIWTLVHRMQTRSHSAPSLT
ncbi:hypothetical protein CYLTODRAFT_239889 [Cylindrobasidium torrendii FP15055 ss-10]|uniref:F-box domain-containing protein n=1 Tax=Cylindrobasidium torrendii FP15055 ss-10 TaxID=1314674 RepID=A0A0D7BT93_9AGAR|nr:hypothetical protein CYLTODRAFT_239889 [Cylindrobasidium torrendii FP15055 ss-10]